MHPSTASTYWCTVLAVHCPSIDVFACSAYLLISVYVNVSITIYLSIYLFIRACASQIPCYIGFHPSFIHSFLLSIHKPFILYNHVLNEPSSKQPKKSCMDYAWIRCSILKSSCLMCRPPRGFLQVLRQATGTDLFRNSLQRLQRSMPGQLNFYEFLSWSESHLHLCFHCLSLPWSKLLLQV